LISNLSFLILKSSNVWLTCYNPLPLGLVWFMLFNCPFQHYFRYMWWSVVSVEETGENHWPVARHWDTLQHNVANWVHLRTLNVLKDSIDTWYDCSPPLERVSHIWLEGQGHKLNSTIHISYTIIHYNIW
jgi:hypothetical protein